MGVGFEITNDKGQTQVTDLAPTVSLYSKTAITSSASTVYISEPIYACEPANNNSLHTSGSRLINTPDPSNGLNYHGRLVGVGNLITYRYGLPSKSTDTFGLEVYDSLGNLKFSSNEKVLRVLEDLYFEDIRTNKILISGRNTYWRKDYGSTRVAGLIIRIPTFSGGSNTVLTTTFARRGNIFSIEDGIYDDNLPTNGLLPTYKCHVLLLEVTGY